MRGKAMQLETEVAKLKADLASQKAEHDQATAKIQKEQATMTEREANLQLTVMALKEVNAMRRNPTRPGLRP